SAKVRSRLQTCMNLGGWPVTFSIGVVTFGRMPDGVGTVLDPFMGGGSTIAAALAVGYESIGIENDPVFYRVAERAIPKLAEFGTEAKPSRAASVRRAPHDERVLPLPFQA
ncbi:MAG: site-specific DNA-methyltransferase, partial [Acidobacteriia bacterium]|nr:site-specific DNA-methyltransferase [Terriglobia bacterium]